MGGDLVLTVLVLAVQQREGVCRRGHGTRLVDALKRLLAKEAAARSLRGRMLAQAPSKCSHRKFTACRGKSIVLAPAEGRTLRSAFPLICTASTLDARRPTEGTRPPASGSSRSCAGRSRRRSCSRRCTMPTPSCAPRTRAPLRCCGSCDHPGPADAGPPPPPRERWTLGTPRTPRLPRLPRQRHALSHQRQAPMRRAIRRAMWRAMGRGCLTGSSPGFRSRRCLHRCFHGTCSAAALSPGAATAARGGGARRSRRRASPLARRTEPTHARRGCHSVGATRQRITSLS